MPAASAFITTYCEPGGLIQVNGGSSQRFRVAGAAYGLADWLNRGATAPNAQAYALATKRYQAALAKAAALPNCSAITADYAAITTP
jgi:hypothetical protein